MIHEDVTLLGNKDSSRIEVLNVCKCIPSKTEKSHVIMWNGETRKILTKGIVAKFCIEF